MNPMQMLIQMMSQGNNPETIIQNMVQRNPSVGPLITQMKQSGLSPKDFAMQYARQTGRDINPILNTMSQFGIKLK